MRPFSEPNRVPPKARGCLLLLLGLGVATAFCDEERASGIPAGVGATVDFLEVRGKRYERVKVLRLSADLVTLQYSGGLVAVRWSELPASWQSALAPVTPPVPTPAPSVASASAPAVVRVRLDLAPPLQRRTEVEDLLAQADATPALAKELDMRQRLQALGLWVKNQGRQPSCAVFAIVSALELQCSLQADEPIRFQEAPLLEATAARTQQRSTSTDTTTADDEEQIDRGYTLAEVVAAAREVGLWRQDGRTERPMRLDIDETYLACQDSASAVRQMIVLLNAGYPLPVGLAWPASRATRGGFLDTQPPVPGFHHAVTVVGYHCPSGQIEDTIFLVKNSWGPLWGASGYGRITYRYLVKNLECAVVLQPRWTPVAE